MAADAAALRIPVAGAAPVAPVTVAVPGALDVIAGAAPAAPDVRSRPGARREPDWVLWALLGYALLVGAYFIVRAGGLMADSDSAAMAFAVRGLAAAERLTPEGGAAYSQGYVFTATSHVLVLVTGLSVGQLQQVVYPLLAAAIVLPAWALYRELCAVARAGCDAGKSFAARAAAFSVLLLFSQPEFLFVILRGSHEALLRLLMLTALWLLVRSFHLHWRPGAFVAHVMLFHAVTFAVVATNTLFGLSFALALAGASALSWIGLRGREQVSQVARTIAPRLGHAVAVVGSVFFLFVFYLYAPATHGLRVFNQVGRKAVELVATTDTGASPYGAVVQGWTSQPVYFLLSSADYLLLAASALLWLRRTLRWATGRAQPSGPGEWMLWSLYAAFALQGFLAIAADRTGLMGSNLQHRAFPSFSMVATPIVALELAGWGAARRRLVARAGGAAALGAFAVFGLLKATNEPSLGNWWVFYTRPELDAMAWTDAHARNSGVWVGPHERLAVAYGVAVGPSANGNFWETFDPGRPMLRTARLYLTTDVIALQSARFGRALPAALTENRVYDSGRAQLYRLRPRTSNQR